MISTLTKIRNNYPKMYKEFEEFVSNEFQTNFINPGTELGLLLHFIQSTIGEEDELFWVCNRYEEGESPVELVFNYYLSTKPITNVASLYVAILEWFEQRENNDYVFKNI